MNKSRALNFLVFFFIIFFFLWFVFQPILETNDLLFHYNKTFYKCQEGYNQETCDNYPSFFHQTVKPLVFNGGIDTFYQISVFILFIIMTAFIFYAFSAVGVLVYFSTGFPFLSIQTFTLPFALLTFLFMIYIYLRNKYISKPHLLVLFYPSCLILASLLHSQGIVLFLLIGFAEVLNHFFKEKIKAFYPGVILVGQKATFGMFLIHFNIILLIQAFKKFSVFHLVVLIPVLYYSFFFDVRASLFAVPLLIDGFSKAFNESKYKLLWVLLLLILILFSFTESIIYHITVFNECSGVPASFIKVFCVPKP